MTILERCYLRAAACMAALTLATSADAIFLCVARNPENGRIKENARIRLRSQCRNAEKPLPVSLTDGESTVLFDGVNVQVISGTGATNGPINGRGNLIVGYNEDLTSPVRSGSHNLVVGAEHTYSAYGGLVVGRENAITGVYASVCGGSENTASGGESSVSGGSANEARGIASSVSGGEGNTARGHSASVSGGDHNEVDGLRSSVSGGQCNYVGTGTPPTCSANANSGWAASISGGFLNNARGAASSVSGGSNNVAIGRSSSVGGGYGNQNTAGAYYSSVGGGFMNHASGIRSSVSGGSGNVAGGSYSSVSGGENRSVAGPGNWRGGGTFWAN